MERRESGWRALFAALALASALIAFQGFGLAIFLSSGCLYRALKGLSMGQALAMSALWGMTFAGFYYHWALAYGPLPWLGLVAVRGLPWIGFGVCLLIAKRLSKEPSVVTDGLACGVSLAAVTGFLLVGMTGADWETPAAVLTDWPFTLALLPYLGLVGIALLIGSCSGLFLSGKRRGVAAGAVVVGVWLALSGIVYGQSEAVGFPMPVALIQTGWDQEMKWDEENTESAKARLFEMTEEAAAHGAKLVVWPETAWPVRGLRRLPAQSRAIAKLARRLSVEILASSIEEVETGRYNSVSQVAANGRWLNEYRKRRLAPFAEYLPLSGERVEVLRGYPPFDRINRYLPGEEQVIFESDDGSYGVLICYESMVTYPTRELVGEVDFVVLVTNDAPFGSVLAQEAHFRSAILRAIEFRLPVLQAANNGVTGFVDSKGRVIERTTIGFLGPRVVHSCSGE